MTVCDHFDKIQYRLSPPGYG